MISITPMSKSINGSRFLACALRSSLVPRPASSMALSQTPRVSLSAGSLTSSQTRSAIVAENISKSPPSQVLCTINRSGPWRVTLDTNPDDCNFSCTMCETFSPFSDKQIKRKEQGIRRRRMSPDLFTRVIQDLAKEGLKEVIPTTMGEPLMYKDIEQFINTVKQHKGLKLNLTTNGSFHSAGKKRSVQEWAHELLPILSDVKISWNGGTKKVQESIMGNSNFETQIKNLQTFVQERDHLAENGGNRPTVTLQLTFMKRNLEDIPKIVQLGIDNNVDRIKGHHLWAHFKEIKDDNLRISKESIKLWNTCVEECRRLADTQPLKSGKHIILENFVTLPIPQADAAESNITFRADPDSDCPFLGKEAWVNHAGKFSPCCAPDDERSSLGDFGSVQEGGIMAIWNSATYRDLVATYKSKPLCQGCQMRK